MGSEFSKTKYDTLEESLIDNKIEVVDLSDYHNYDFNKNKTLSNIPVYLEEAVTRWSKIHFNYCQLQHQGKNLQGPAPVLTTTD
jgi:hypothetical protein